MPVKSQLPPGKISRETERELSRVHIDHTWSLLETKFCFNIKAWKQDYVAYYQKHSGRMSEQEAFIEFGMEFINPLLNRILMRKPYYDTWPRILHYIIREH